MPLWGWRSIFEASKLLKEGLQWSDGKNSLLEIWKDTWLNDHVRCKPIIIPNGKVLLVKDLMTREGYSFDLGKVKSVLWPINVEPILNAPISDVRDKLL